MTDFVAVYLITNHEEAREAIRALGFTVEPIDTCDLIGKYASYDESSELLDHILYVDGDKFSEEIVKLEGEIMTCSGRTIGPGKYVSYIDFIETEIWDDSKLSHQYVDFESLMV